MERVLTVEEKIRRAEEIYERRKRGETGHVAKVTVNEKKDIKLIRKMLIQIAICIAIYLFIYTVQNNEYIFSKDFIQKANDILSYDTNFIEIYENIKNQITGFMQKQPDETSNDEAIGGAEDITEEQTEQPTQEMTDNTLDEQSVENLSQEQINIMNIKNTTTFIKPIEGVITSKYGQRETSNANIPKNHTGIDIAADLGTKIKSATDGEVVLSSEEGDYGKHLKIQIGEVSIIYAHCNNLYVKQGDKITQGQEIAEVGSTGNSTRTTSTF